MAARARWCLFEATKFVLFLALFVWIQNRIIDTKYEAILQTAGVAEAQGRQATRLFSLQHDAEAAEVALAETEARTDSLSADLDRQGALLRNGRADLREMMEVHDSQLRSLIQTRIDRIEITAASSSEQSARVGDRLEQLEQSMPPRDPFEMKQRMIYPVVQLRGNGTVGSGVVIYSGRQAEGTAVETYVLTAYHVVLEILEGAAGGTSISDLRFVDPTTDQISEQPFASELLAFHQEADIALISVTLEEPWPYVAKAASRETLGRLGIFDPVYAVGCPLGNKPMPTHGEISSQDKVVEGQRFWMVNAPTFFGNSGGGVYQQQTGELLGISSMIYTYGKSQPMVVPHMGLFIPMDTIRTWARDSGPEGVCARIFPDETPVAAAEETPALLQPAEFKEE